MWLAWACPGCVAVLGLLGAAIPALFAVRFHRRAALLGAMRASDVAALKPGPAKIKARVVAQQHLLTSPMGQQPCVYYRFQVEERQKVTRGSRHGGPTMAWVPLIDDVQAIDVVLEDATGQAEIDLRDAEIVGKSLEKTSSVFDDPPQRLKALLRNRYGTSTRGLLFNKTMSFTETVLGDGAKVVVVGDVKVTRDGLPVLRAGVVPLVVSDKGSKGVGAPYQRKAVYCWVGVAFLLVATTVLSIMFGLVASMFHPAPDSQPQAANPAPGQQPRLGQPPPHPGADAIAQLVADLKAPDPAQRKAAAEKLAAMPVDEAQRPTVKRGLEAMLRNPDPETAPAALRALQTWGDEETVPQLQQLFALRDAPYHEQVIRTLAKFPTAQALETLAGGLADARDRAAICDALREVGPAAEPSVLRQLAVTMDPDAKGDICFLLSDIGGPASAAALQRLTGDPDPKVAVKAAAALNLLRDRPHDK